MFELVAYAEPVVDATANPTTAVMGQLITFAVIIGLLYFMMIRPQKKREKKTREMLSAMKVGDKIVTIGGIVGKITKIKDEFVFIETGSVGNPNEKSYLKMERSAIKEVEIKEEA